MRNGNGATPNGLVEIFGALTGVAAGFGVASGAHHGKPEGSDGIPECGFFAGAEYESDGWEGSSQGADELDEVAI